MKLVINGIDFTSKIQKDSYNVNAEYETKEWSDLNHRYHKSQIRKRVKGSMDLAFISVNGADYQNFKANYDNATNDNCELRATVHIQNTDTVESLLFFPKLTMKKQRYGLDDYRVDLVTLELEEC